ncbi:hypothetical protein Zmor_002149 [Zophobas morio]|uniref:Uncharacterized protein n=1 Tax=Zophobas morio TaxID=2755281 RepID=A0AA38J6Z3_9CUCU|nr:hypothetical protein Zmor_002149 [Zophobas morio]
MDKSLILLSLLMTGYHLVEAGLIFSGISRGARIGAGIGAGVGARIGIGIAGGLRPESNQVTSAPWLPQIIEQNIPDEEISGIISTLGSLVTSSIGVSLVTELVENIGK